MSTIGIVALSVVAAIFLFALLAGLVLLIWLAWGLKKALAAMQVEHAALLAAVRQQVDSVHAKTGELVTSNSAELKAAIESAKGSFGSIRAEVKTAIEGQQKSLAVIVDQFKLDIGAAIVKINAEALQTVAVRLTQVCIRAEKAIGVLQQLILDTEKGPAFDGGAEDFAPENSNFGGPPTSYSLGQTARLDQEADLTQQAEQLTESPAEV